MKLRSRSISIHLFKGAIVLLISANCNILEFNLNHNPPLTVLSAVFFQSVDLVLEKTEQQVMIHVRDRGIGISLLHQNRIFEQFYRVDESMTRSRDGTGLGLAIAKSLIEGMDGRITIRSKPGEGSIFTITLPVWKL